jgi:hypothetical protein
MLRILFVLLAACGSSTPKASSTGDTPPGTKPPGDDPPPGRRACIAHFSSCSCASTCGEAVDPDPNRVDCARHCSKDEITPAPTCGWKNGVCGAL